jgi:putative flippase GtrA
VTSGQFIRFVVVGFASNLFLFFIYLVLTYFGMGHKTAMSVLYATGTCLTFVFNRNWTFMDKGHIQRAFFIYILIYVFGYLFNLGGLYYFVDMLGFNHVWVQGVLVLCIALLLFVMQKKIVFKQATIDVDDNNKGSGTP